MRVLFNCMGVYTLLHVCYGMYCHTGKVTLKVLLNIVDVTAHRLLLFYKLYKYYII